MEFPQTPLQEWLEHHFPQATLLVVGGSVRDAVRGHPSKDLDLEIVGVEAQQVVGRWPWHARQVGKSFSHHLVELEELGWVEVSFESGSLQDWDRLCRRRDFTCNAMAWHCHRRELLDPLGGQRDMQEGVLRQASPESLLEDPLRVWRALQFCARFGWRPEPTTLATLKAQIPRLSDLPAERVTREWEKLLCLPESPGVALGLLKEWGMLSLFPELEALVGCPQDPTYHPEGDVWTHTCMVVDQAAAIARRDGLSQGDHLTLMLAALLHDLGKPSTTRQEGQRWTAHGHEHAGQVPARHWLQRYCFGEQVGAAVLDCVAHHMRPLQLQRDIDGGRLSPSQQVNALRRLLRSLEAVSWEVFIRLCEADRRGRGGEGEGEFRAAEVLGNLLRDHPVAELARSTLLQGRDLLALGLSAGPQLGEWIRKVEAARDEGLLQTRDEAVTWIKQRLTC